MADPRFLLLLTAALVASCACVRAASAADTSEEALALSRTQTALEEWLQERDEAGLLAAKHTQQRRACPCRRQVTCVVNCPVVSRPCYCYPNLVDALPRPPRERPQPDPQQQQQQEQPQQEQPQQQQQQQQPSEPQRPPMMPTQITQGPAPAPAQTITLQAPPPPTPLVFEPPAPQKSTTLPLPKIDPPAAASESIVNQSAESDGYIPPPEPVFEPWHPSEDMLKPRVVYIKEKPKPPIITVVPEKRHIILDQQSVGPIVFHVQPDIPQVREKPTTVKATGQQNRMQLKVKARKAPRPIVHVRKSSYAAKRTRVNISIQGWSEKLTPLYGKKPRKEDGGDDDDDDDDD